VQIKQITIISLFANGCENYTGLFAEGGAQIKGLIFIFFSKKNKTMTEEKVVIESRRENGGTLVGLLTRKSPVVTSIALICHGQLGSFIYLID